MMMDHHACERTAEVGSALAGGPPSWSIWVQLVAAGLTAAGTLGLAYLTWRNIQHAIAMELRRAELLEEERTPVLAIEAIHSAPAPKHEDPEKATLRVNFFNFGRAPIRILQARVEGSGSRAPITRVNLFVPVLDTGGEAVAYVVPAPGLIRESGTAASLSIAFQYGLTGSRIHQASLDILLDQPKAANQMYRARSVERDVELLKDAGLLDR